jgi:hypothetical protein
MADFASTSENDASPGTVPPELSGFDRIFPLLKVLGNVHSATTFYERMLILLTLARWEGGEPPTANDLARRTSLSLEALSWSLQKLRAAGWLGGDDRRYTLTPHGRILMFMLRIVAQPWEEGDTSAVVAQMYAAASSEDVGLGPSLLFDTVVSTIEERVRQLIGILALDTTEAVGQRLKESARDVRMAQRALELRKDGTIGDEDFTQIHRMHTAVSQLSEVSGKLDSRYLQLLARDLLAQGQVSIGDITNWMLEATEDERASILWPHLQLPIIGAWGVPEQVIFAAAADVAGRPERPVFRQVPPARPMDIGAPHLPRHPTRDRALLQTQLRQHLQQQPVPLAIREWVNQPSWPEAIAHLVAMVDPQLSEDATPIFLHPDSRGRLESLDDGPVAAITSGVLSLESQHDQRASDRDLPGSADAPSPSSVPLSRSE